MLGEEMGIDDTIIEKRIKDVIATGKNYLYKPRSGAINKHTKLITDE